MKRFLFSLKKGFLGFLRLRPINAVLVLIPYLFLLGWSLVIPGDSLDVVGLGRNESFEIDRGTNYIGDDFGDSGSSVVATISGAACKVSIENHSDSLYLGADDWLRVYDSAGKEVVTSTSGVYVRFNDKVETVLLLHGEYQEPLKIVCTLQRKGRIYRFAWSTDSSYVVMSEIRSKLDFAFFWFSQRIDDISGLRLSYPSVEVVQEGDHWSVKGLLIPDVLVDPEVRGTKEGYVLATFSKDLDLEAISINGRNYGVQQFRGRL